MGLSLIEFEIGRVALRGIGIGIGVGVGVIVGVGSGIGDDGDIHSRLLGCCGGGAAHGDNWSVLGLKCWVNE